MTKTFEQRTVYTRLENGVDLYTLKTYTKDIIVTDIAVPGGALALRDNPILGTLLTNMFPFGIRGKKKTAVLDDFEHMGVQVQFSVEQDYFCIRLVSRKVVFADALTLLVSVLTKPVLEAREWNIAFARTQQITHHAKENTKTQADIAIRRQLFKKQHPLWTPDIPSRLRSLGKTKKKDIENACSLLQTGTGTIITVVGDIQINQTIKQVTAIANTFTNQKSVLENTSYPVTKIQGDATKRDTVVSIQDKENVHCVMGIPLALTYEDSEFLPVLLAMQILGASSSSRLFETLRVKESLTYGAYASLTGYAHIHPGFLYAMAIFPTDVFLKGRERMFEVLKTFVQHGVTAVEVKEHKETIIGSQSVKLASTVGTANILSGVLKAGKPLRYLDEFTERVAALRVSEVNKAIQEHIDFTLLKSASAGGVQKNGKPL